MSLLGEIVEGTLQLAFEGVINGALSRKQRTPPSPGQPSPFEVITMVIGGIAIAYCLIGLALACVQWQRERYVLSQPAISATIVSLERKQSGDNRFTDARLDYERTSRTGPVACRLAAARFIRGAQDLKIGGTVEVYPQPGSCAQPFYAPDVGNPRATLIASLIALPIGIVLSCIGYASLRGRQRRLGMTLPSATPTSPAS